MVILLTPSPVGKQRSQDHQGVLHQRDNFRGGVTTQEKFTAVLEGAKLEGQAAPVGNDLLQLGFDVLLLHSADADILFGRKKRASGLRTFWDFLCQRIQGVFPWEPEQGTNRGQTEKKGQTQKGSNKRFRMLAVILFGIFFSF